MKPESRFWSSLRPVLVRHGHFVRVENTLEGGTPDVNFCVDGVEGWLELKVLPAWPARDDTPVRVPHLTNVQAGWINYRWSRGGRVYLLLKVEASKEWLLFAGDKVIGLSKSRWPKYSVIENSCGHWSDRGSMSALVRALSGPGR